MKLKELQNPPTLANLMERAHAVEEPEKSLRYYMTVIKVLKHQKGMTGRQISVWLKENDCGDHSESTIYKLLRRNP